MLFAAALLFGGAWAGEKAVKMPIKLGGLFPLGMVESDGSSLGSLADQGLEWREAMKVAVEMINSSDEWDITIEYGADPVTGTLMDTGVDAAFSGSDTVAGVAEGDNEAKLGGTPSARNNKYAADNAQSQLCQSARKLCDDADVVAVIGACRSSRSIGAARCCMSNSGLPQISYASTSSYLTNSVEFPSFFRAVPNDNFQAAAIVALLKEYNFEKVGMVYTDDAYAGGMARKFKELWLAEGKQFSPPIPAADDITKDFFLKIHKVEGDDGRELVRRLKREGDAGATLVFAISGDSDLFMKYFQDEGMTGLGWTYMGGDGSTSTDLTGHTAKFRDAYQGFVGSNVKGGNRASAEYVRFVNTWETMFENSQVSMVPWQGRTDLIMTAFSTQTHDAVMAAATAAQNWYRRQTCTYNAGSPTECKMTRADMQAELGRAGFEVRRALGNSLPCNQQVPSGERCFRFAGRDGPVSYDIMNAYSDTWNDVGDYDDISKLTIAHPIEWAGGTSNAPTTSGRPMTASTTDESDDGLPAWVPAIIVVLILAVCLIALGMCWLIKKEKEGKAVFDSNQM